MRKPTKKRVLLHKDGRYYPQYKGWFFWHAFYGIQSWYPFNEEVVRYVSVELALEYLEKKHQEEQQAIKLAKQSKIIEFVQS